MLNFIIVCIDVSGRIVPSHRPVLHVLACVMMWALPFVRGVAENATSCDVAIALGYALHRYELIWACEQVLVSEPAPHCCERGACCGKPAWLVVTEGVTRWDSQEWDSNGSFETARGGSRQAVRAGDPQRSTAHNSGNRRHGTSQVLPPRH